MNHVGPQRPHAGTPAPPPILSARGVVKTYRSGAHEVPALRGVDLDVHAAELVTVMGPSGNGKTTLLNCLSGLDDIDAGTVTVDGTDLFAMSDAKRTRHRAIRMGFVFQAIYELMRAHLHRLLDQLGDEDGWVPLRTVVDAAQERYHAHSLFPKGRVRNYCTFAKVDLEARGEIERAPGRAAQRIRLANHGANISPYLDAEE